MSDVSNAQAVQHAAKHFQQHTAKASTPKGHKSHLVKQVFLLSKNPGKRNLLT